MEIRQTTSLTEEEKYTALSLWNNEYPGSLSYKGISEFDDYLGKLNDQRHYLLMEEKMTVGWAFEFVRDHAKWFALIISGSMQGRGLGTVLLDQIKKNNPLISGWVVDHNGYQKKDGSTYKSPLKFYLKNGFLIQPERLDTGKITAVKIIWQVES